MSLYGYPDSVPEFYLVSLINSSLLSYYVDSFVNNTQTFQINDARQLPVMIPTDTQLDRIRSIFNDALSIKKRQFSEVYGGITTNEHIDILQENLDQYILTIYRIKDNNK